MDFENIFPLRQFCSTELECDLWDWLGEPVRPGHAREIVARFFGFRTEAALRASGLLESDRIAGPIVLDHTAAIERAVELTKLANDNLADAVEKSLRQLIDTLTSDATSLAVRLVLNLCCLAEWLPEANVISGYALLTREDLMACGEIAARDDFHDLIFTSQPRPTIAYIAGSIDVVERTSGLHQVFPDAILNVAAFVLGTARVWRLLHRYVLRVDGERAFANGVPNRSPMWEAARSRKRDPR